MPKLEKLPSFFFFFLEDKFGKYPKIHLFLIWLRISELSQRNMVRMSSWTFSSHLQQHSRRQVIEILKEFEGDLNA